VCVCVCVCVCDLSILLHGGQAEVSAQDVFLLTRELQNGLKARQSSQVSATVYLH
jgi:hypothetical protein